MQRNRIETPAWAASRVGFHRRGSVRHHQPGLLRERPRHRAQQPGAQHRLRRHRPVFVPRRDRRQADRRHCASVMRRSSCYPDARTDSRSRAQAQCRHADPQQSRDPGPRQGACCVAIRAGSQESTPVAFAGASPNSRSVSRQARQRHRRARERRTPTSTATTPTAVAASSTSVRRSRCSVTRGFETWRARARRRGCAHSFVAELRVDASGRLPAGSPARSSVASLDAVTDDIDGRPRVAPFDVGADGGRRFLLVVPRTRDPSYDPSKRQKRQWIPRARNDGTSSCRGASRKHSSSSAEVRCGVRDRSGAAYAAHQKTGMNRAATALDKPASFQAEGRAPDRRTRTRSLAWRLRRRHGAGLRCVPRPMPALPASDQAS